MDIQWIGLSDNRSVLSHIQNALEQGNRSLELLDSETELLQVIDSQKPTVLVLKESNRYNIYDLCRYYAIDYSNVAILLLVKEEDYDLKKAMRVGATDVLTYSSRQQELFEAIQASENLLSQKFNQNGQPKGLGDNRDGHVITICSTKGGVGKTTLAVNLATALAKNKQSVVLVDLDLQFGDVFLFYDRKPKKTIYEWVKTGNETTIKDYITSHESEVDIFASPLRPEFAEAITGDHVKQLITALKKIYDVIILDTAPFFIEPTLVALEASDEILNVVTLDLPTFKNNQLLIETLDSLGLKEKTKVIVNKDGRVVGMEPETVENVLDLPVFARIPMDKKWVLQSVNKGEPLILTRPRIPMSKEILRLAYRVTPNKITSNKVMLKQKKRAKKKRAVKGRR